MRITVLAENTAIDSRFDAEHGLSLYIETDKHRILFDMGQTSLFSKTAETLHIDLTQVDFAVLSHGHYDHGGGLADFLKINRHAKVYVNQNAFFPYYNAENKYIGLDPKLLENEQIVLIDDTFDIEEGFTLFSCNDRVRQFDCASIGLQKKIDGQLLPDDYLHEQYLRIEENGKTILISGCSHKGILDIAAWFAPDVLIGGFHFSKLPTDEKLTEYAKALAAYNTDFYTCHCTGTAQFTFMQQYMPRLSYLSTGKIIEI